MLWSISLEHKIPMADSIILATGRLYQATVWTQDIDFKGLKDVKFIRKKK
jgi:predicted nucleic acid-binding protein